MNNIGYYISTVSDGNIGLHIGDNEEKVISNRKKIASKLNYSLEDFVYLDQVHSNEVKIMSFDSNPSLNSFLWKRKEEQSVACDSIVTKEKGLVLSIMIADCVPILLYDDINKVVGAIHAGWKGTYKKIVKNTISDMLKIGANIDNIKAIIGPSVSSCSYEVGEEVGINFRDEVKTELINGKQYLDLKKENNLQLLESGVKESNIEIMNVDTFTDKNYFSARRDGYGKGRFGIFIWIK